VTMVADSRHGLRKIAGPPAHWSGHPVTLQPVDPIGPTTDR
jgi:hypothetical protein